MVIRGKVDKQKLLNIYDTCNRIFNESNCFYTKQQLEDLKQKQNYNFIGVKNGN